MDYKNQYKLQRNPACNRLPGYTMSKGNVRWAKCLQDGNYMGEEVGITEGRKEY